MEIMGTRKSIIAGSGFGVNPAHKCVREKTFHKDGTKKARRASTFIARGTGAVI
jgi:hypothetical protein